MISDYIVPALFVVGYHKHMYTTATSVRPAHQQVRPASRRMQQIMPSIARTKPTKPNKRITNRTATVEHRF